MAIFALQPVALVPANDEEAIGRELFLSSFNHFSEFLGQPGIGLSYDSCNAAVAVNHIAVPGYGHVSLNAGAILFSVLYGSSRLYTGLDPDYNILHAGNIAPGRPFSSSILEEHAEQTAIRMAETRHVPFWNHGGHFHIYIVLSPCFLCHAWLLAHPGNWYVHYLAHLQNKGIAFKEKRTFRVRKFGRAMERYSTKKGPFDTTKRRRVVKFK